MKPNKKELNVDAIGSTKSLSKVQEREISAFIKSMKDSYTVTKKSARSKSGIKDLAISVATR